MKKALMIMGLIGLMGLMGWVGWRAATVSQHTVQVADTLRVTVTDTVAFYQPVARDSLVIRYVTRVLPTSSWESHEAEDTIDEVAMASRQTEHILPDSMAVEVPISQKKYETERYRAYVSGFEPRLDSIFVYQKTITEKIVPTEKQRARQPRVGFGVVAGAGYGLIHKQGDVFVGGAVYLRLWP